MKVSKIILLCASMLMMASCTTNTTSKTSQITSEIPTISSINKVDPNIAKVEQQVIRCMSWNGDYWYEIIETKHVFDRELALWDNELGKSYKEVCSCYVCYFICNPNRDSHYYIEHLFVAFDSKGEIKKSELLKHE